MTCSALLEDICHLCKSQRNNVASGNEEDKYFFNTKQEPTLIVNNVHVEYIAHPLARQTYI